MAARKMLGLTKARLSSSLPRLFPEARKVEGRTNHWAISRSSIYALLESCGCPLIANVGSGQVSLDHVLRYWACSNSEAAEVLSAIRAQTIKPIGQLPNKVGLGKLIFMEDEVRHVINETRTIEPNHWSVPQVAEMLNIKQEVAYFLVRQGLLESNSEVIGRRESAVVTREGLNAFRTKYVFARDLAKLHRTNSRSLQARLAEINIQPVTSPLAGKCRQIIYEQTLALIRLFPMSANHASPMMAISP